ncbi:MAG: hypothetical protein H5T86_09040, partial [Armatimonadetes bacterium]|nr:hypothetical protein [Armatimonadota bacterium]
MRADRRFHGIAFVIYATSIGFFSLLVQVVLMRELLASFFGNELVIGILLADWLLLVALGAWLAGSFGLGVASWHLAAGHGLLAAAIPFSLYAARAVGAHGWLPGLTVGPFETALRAALALVFPCLALGAAFSMAVRFAETALGYGRASGARAYALESFGAVVGGILFHVYLADRLASSGIAVCLAISAAVVGVAVSGRITVPRMAAAALTAALLMSLAPRASRWLDVVSLRARWTGFHLLDSLNTRYGNIAVCRQDSQLAFYCDGLLSITTEDLVANEELAHLALLCADLERGSRRVLVIGGGFGGLLREIAKHPVSRVDYMDLDAQAVKFIEKYAGAEEERLLGNRLHLVHADARAALRGGPAQRYAAVIFNLPPPHNAVVARLYSVEFLRRSLLPHLQESRGGRAGVVVIRLPGAQTTLSRERAMLHKSIYLALKEALSGEDPVVAVGEGGVYLLASPGGLPADALHLVQLLIRRYQHRKLATSFLTPAQIGYMLNPFRVELYRRSLDQVDVPPTSDRLPICYRYYLSLWARQYSPKLAVALDRAPIVVETAGAVLLGCALFLALLATRTGLGSGAAASLVVATCGLAEMAASFLVMLEFQIHVGYLFHQLGLLTGLFMGGLALGSWLAAEGPNIASSPALRWAQRLTLPGVAWLAAAAVLAVLCIVVLPAGGQQWPARLATCLLGAVPWSLLALAVTAWHLWQRFLGPAHGDTDTATSPHAPVQSPGLSRKSAGIGLVTAGVLLVAVGCWASMSAARPVGQALVATVILGLPTGAVVWLSVLLLGRPLVRGSAAASVRLRLVGCLGLLAVSMGPVAFLAAGGEVLDPAWVPSVCGFSSLYAGLAGGSVYALCVALAGGE